MIQHRSPVSGIASFGARHVATAGYDNQIILWDAASKRAVARAYHDHLANQCRFSPSGASLVSASSDHTARVWSIPDLRLRAVLDGHEDDVEMAVFSPDETRIATASRDHRVRIFAVGGRLLATMTGHTADVISVEWSPDGRALVSSSDDGTVRRWSADGSLLGTIDLGGVESDTVVCGDDGVIYVGTDDGDIVVIAAGVVRRVQAHRAGIKRLVHDPGSATLLSAGYDRSVKLWSTRGGDVTLTHVTEAPACVWLRACAFASPDELVFGTFGSAYASYHPARERWDLREVEDTPGCNAVRVVDGDTYCVGDAGVVRRNGEVVARMGSLCNFLQPWSGRVLTGGHLGVLFDACTGAPLFRNASPLNCGVDFVVDGEPRCVIGTYTGEGLVFGVGPDGAPVLLARVALHGNAIKGLAAAGGTLFSVCATGAAAFHDLATLTCIRTIERAHDKISNGAACLPDGRFVSVSRDRELRIWTLETRLEVATPHTHSIKCVAVCPATGVVATGSYNGTVALYDPAQDRWTAAQRPTAAGISSITASGHPGVFLASSYDGESYWVPCAPAR